MKTLTITNVRTIFSIAKPIVIFDVAGHDSIVRNPKQALIDLQNSGRALDLKPTALNSGVENTPQATVKLFVEALHETIGANLTGDITAYKAGDEYLVTENSQAVNDSKHPLYGKVKVGDKAKADNDGVRVEGFLSIPQTFQERQIKANANSMTTAMLAMFGFAGATGNTAPIANDQPFDKDADDDESNAFTEGVGKTAKQTK